MEDKSVEGPICSANDGTVAPTSSRWNPTKEQISVLESLYKQGMRTPSAEQIQQITSRLKVYGHIEGKNVFYWFQNHKARQRQKQKQECMVYINQFLHKAAHHPAAFTPTPPPCTNVVCSPFFIPQSSIGYYPQHGKVPLPSSVRKRPIADKLQMSSTYNKITEAAAENPRRYDTMHALGDTNEENIKNNNNNNNYHQETLALFPLHPTGILEQGRRGRKYGNSLSPLSSSSSSLPSDASTGRDCDIPPSVSPDDQTGNILHDDREDGCEYSGSASPSLIDFFASS